MKTSILFFFGKYLILVLGILTIIWSSNLFYARYQDYLAKKNGETISVDIVEVDNCEVYSKSYLIGVLYKEKVRYISISKSDCRKYTSQEKLAVIYDKKTDKLLNPNSKPLRDMALISAFIVLGGITSILGIKIIKK